MAESTQDHGNSLPEQPILSGLPIPSIVVSHHYENQDSDAALYATFAEYNDATQIPALLKKYKSMSIESDATTESSSPLLTPSRSSFSNEDGNDGDDTDEKEYLGYFILPARDAQRTFDNSHPENAPLDGMYQAFQQSSMPCHVMEDHGLYQDAQVYFQASAPSHHDGPFDTRPPVVTAQVSRFAAENVQFGPDLTTSTYLVDVPGHSGRPTIDLLGNSGGNEDQTLHDVHFYLKFTDDFRETLNKGVAMYDDELDMLSSVLEEILAHEGVGKGAMPLSTIVYARLEKLLQSLVDHPGRGQHAIRPNLRNVIRLAVSLQRKWQMRFRGELFNIDNERLRYVVMHGLLAHVHMESSPNDDGSAAWVVDKPWRAVGTDLINFPIGQWWPNIVCALRDGVFNPTGDKKVGSNQLVTYVALLKGVESFDQESGCMIYELECKLEDIFVYLQDKVGKKIRLLRGYKLKSGNAPKIGIRYDGSHMLRRYSLKLLDTSKHLYRVMLHYDAVQGESGVNKDFIKPSIQDDWEIYKKIEKSEMKKFCSEAHFYEWQAVEELEIKDTQEWHRRRKFRQQAKDLNI